MVRTQPAILALRLVLATGAGALWASASEKLAARPVPERGTEAMVAHWAEADARAVAPLLTATDGDLDKLDAALRARAEQDVNQQTFKITVTFAQQLHAHALATGQPALRGTAATLADRAFVAFALPNGTFTEGERFTWIPPGDEWRMIPWGTAFFGHQLLDAYRVMHDDLPPARHAEWEAHFRRTATWIDGNPWLGTYVFNCTIDLCHLLWRLGETFHEASWKTAALDAARTLVARHVDPAGWITWENGGVSGSYQLLGAHFLGLFAYESRDPALVAATHRFAATALAYATPSLLFMGNFGTRSPTVRRIDNTLFLAAAATGHAPSAAIVRSHGRPTWSRDPALWAAAHATVPSALPAPDAIATFPGIAGTTLRAGPWQSWFNNYAKNLWSRGFIGLLHETADTVVFATQHALPSVVEQAKLRLSDSTDWAGFPHIRVTAGDTRYDSHQQLGDLTTESTATTSTARWRESLLSPAGATGGELAATLVLADPALTLTLDLAALAGPPTLDFHLQKRGQILHGFWAGAEVAALRARELPVSGGQFRDRTIPLAEARDFAIQIDRAIWIFQVREAPAGTVVTLADGGTKGLHTGDLGGLKLRLTLPADATAARIVLTCERLRSTP